MQEGHEPGAIFGHRATDEVRWRGHNTWDLAENLEGLFLQLDTGNGSPGGPAGDTGDPIETGCWEMMTNLHNRLVELGYDHIWNYYGAGGHNWWYWQRDLKELLPRLMDRFANPVPAPEPVHLHVDRHRPTTCGAGRSTSIARRSSSAASSTPAPTGFKLTGSGAATVTTGPLFAPGQQVRADDHRRRRRARCRARQPTMPAASPSRCRSVTGNPYQQRTVQGTAWALTTGAAPGTWPSVTATVELEPADAAGSPVEAMAAHAAPPASTGAGGSLPATGGAELVPLALVLAAAGLLLRPLLRRLV